MQICFSIFTKFLLVGGGKRIETVEVTEQMCPVSWKLSDYSSM